MDAESAKQGNKSRLSAWASPTGDSLTIVVSRSVPEFLPLSLLYRRGGARQAEATRHLLQGPVFSHLPSGPGRSPRAKSPEHPPEIMTHSSRNFGKIVLPPTRLPPKTQKPINPKTTKALRPNGLSNSPKPQAIDAAQRRSKMEHSRARPPIP